MFYVKVWNGLANRMRTIASACTLAEKYRQKVTVFWPVSKDCNTVYQALFLSHPNLKIVNYSFKYDLRIIWAMMLSKMRFKYLKQQDVEQIQSLESCLKHGRSVFVNTCEQLGNIKNYEIFHPVPKIMESVNGLFPLAHNSDRRYAIHIRRTDNFFSCQHSPTELFVEQIKMILEKSPDTKFFLATDSGEEEATLCRLFPENIIVNTHKCLDRNSSDGIKDALVDMVCLSRAQVIFGSYWSSFSEVAAAWTLDGVSSQLTILSNKK